MSIHETLKKSIPDAMRARDEVKLRTLRSLITQMTNEVVAKKRKPNEFLTDEDALIVLKRSASQRKDSIEQFTLGKRDDLVARETAELAILEALLPAEMPRAEIEEAARARIAALGGAAAQTKTGAIIGSLMKDLKGKNADGTVVKEVVESLLEQK